MIGSLRGSQPSGGGAASVSDQRPDISDLRRSLDEVDSGIVGLIAQRSRVIAEIARLKEHGTSAIQDADRERQVLAGVEAVAADLGVSASLVRRIFRELIGDSVAQQARHLAGAATGRLRVAFGLSARIQRRGCAQVPGRPGGQKATWRATAHSARPSARCWRAR